MKRIISAIILIVMMMTTVSLADTSDLDEIFTEYSNFMAGEWSNPYDESMLQNAYGSGIEGKFTFNARRLFVDASGAAYYDMNGPIVRVLINPEADTIMLIWGDRVALTYSRK